MAAKALVPMLWLIFFLQLCRISMKAGMNQADHVNSMGCCQCWKKGA